MRRPQVGDLDPLRRKAASDPIGNVARIGHVIDMLKLASAAFGKMAARRHRMMRAGHEGAVWVHNVARCGKRDMASVCSNAFASRRDPHDTV